MNCKKRSPLIPIFLCAIALGSWGPPAMADEDPPASATDEAAVNSGPEETPVQFKTEGDFYLGYRWVSTEDSLKAAEYLYPHNSVSFGLNLLSVPLPYRYHVNADFISQHDFYADAGFAYSDIILFRDILVGVPHYLNHYDYGFTGEPPALYFTEKNGDEDYYINYVNNLMSLRLKAKDYPFHTFAKYRYVEREGTIQQRYLLGYFDDLNKVSEARDIKWDSNDVLLGTNTHFGPVEIEYTFDKADFDPGPNNVLYDFYPDNESRPGDIYPHNVIPGSDSWANTVKVHTSYTGGIVAAATLGNLIEKNDYSLAESSTWKGAFDFSWIPDPKVSIFFKYRHRDLDMDTPETVTLHGSENSITYDVRPGISYDKDVLSLTGRYKPISMLSLFATYQYTHLDYQDVDAWDLYYDDSSIHSINLTAHARPTNKVKLKAIYEYKNYDQPVYNTTPDHSNKLRLTANYIPLSWLNVYLQYILYTSDRDPMRYLNPDPAELLETGKRDGRGDQILASLTTTLSPKTSLTFSWFYQRWDIDQDLAFGKWNTEGGGDLPFIDDVAYTDDANSFSLALLWLPREDISVTADVTYTITNGKTGFSDIVGDASYSLATFSDFEVDETTFSIDLGKKLAKAWEIDLKAYLNVYNDRTSDLLDGSVFTTTLALKRYF